MTGPALVHFRGESRRERDMWLLHDEVLPPSPGQGPLLAVRIDLRAELFGCGSKKRYQNGTLVSGNMDQNPRNPSCLILSHSQEIPQNESLSQNGRLFSKWVDLVLVPVVCGF